MKTTINIQSPQEIAAFTGRQIRTFLADDDPFMLALLGRLLAKDPKVTLIGSALDGWKALQAAAALHADLVLTDLHMPIVDGLELTRRLKQLPKPPVIFVVTSDDTPEALTRCLTAGADAFLVKAADLHLQLQTAMEDFFPREREQAQQPQNQSYELVTAAN